MIMKTALVTCISFVALALCAFGQDPTITPAASAVATPLVTPAAAASASPAATVSRRDDDETLEERIEKKVKKGLSITFGDDDDTPRDRHRGPNFSEDDSWLAIPIVGVVFLSIFGTPVLIVATIMYFSMSKTRALHRTVRMMVEKGQEVPAALLNPPPAQRQRSDMRRGVVLVMVGLGVMVFLGAVNDWEGGAWALGIIPFLIGLGYLAVWKLEQNKTSTDIPTSLP
jgi:hypothetical protein